ncbi:MAG: hypothetical protein COA78_23560 [Blastopirellula sp.]|nr:MAG: hypothetical protein COA78_23560 [Blastopirellula sp.]
MNPSIKLLVAVFLMVSAPIMAEPWKRHIIDDFSKGADGIRLADVNQDNLMDITTGWEEGGKIRVYINPGHLKSKDKWPAVTVGDVKSPEDAVFVDLDQDGATDVVSSCEGSNKTIYIHWAPAKKSDYLNPQKWETTALPGSAKQQSWMFALPMQIDGKHGLDLVVGSKGSNATVGWWQAPENPRELDKWKFYPLYKAAWIMSIRSEDVDGDGDQDILFNDRKGANPGIYWLEYPGKNEATEIKAWELHKIGASGLENLFLDLGDLNKDGLTDIAQATRNGKIHVFLRTSASKPSWETIQITNPDNYKNGKAVHFADLDNDGKMDLIHNIGPGDKKVGPGMVWMRATPAGFNQPWEVFDISGKDGIKFDRIETLDLDGDGDLDVITCEERQNLGVFWYENPLINTK